MSEEKERRKSQLARLLHTAAGRERLAEIYRHVCLPAGDMRAIKKSFRRMALEILKTEFPDQPNEREKPP